MDRFRSAADEIRCGKQDASQERGAGAKADRPGPAAGRARAGGPWRRKWARWLFPITGLGALAWFLVRVVPKPSRASYPCQRAAFPVASTFLVWLLGTGGAVLAFRKGRERLREARYLVGAMCILLGLALALVSLGTMPTQGALAQANSPLGTARGIYPGRVVWIHNPAATNESWTTTCGYRYYHPTYTIQAQVDLMVSDGVQWLTGTATDADAWDALFRYFNRNHAKGDVGYQAGEKIAIKVNLNNCSGYTAENDFPDVCPQVVYALLGQLVNQAGVPQNKITVYDASRYVANKIYNYCTVSPGGFAGVIYADKGGTSGRTLVVGDGANPMYYNEAGCNSPDYLPTCATEAAYIINLGILRRHDLAGVTFCGKNLFGTIQKTLGGSWSPSDLHEETYHKTDNPRPMGSYNPIVDLLGHRHMGGKTMLFVLDFLWSCMTQNTSKPTKWQIAPFSDDYPSSMLFSQDPIGCDSVAYDFLLAEVTARGSPVMLPNCDNYLHQGAQPPATRYDPENDGTFLASLGAHEHWNNAASKQYTRNLGTGLGIELVSSDPGTNQLPIVSITDPTEGQNFPALADITITASASDPDGAVDSVEFFKDSISIGLDDDGGDGWSILWQDVPAGQYALTARAMDLQGAVGWSAPVTITVGAANLPPTVSITSPTEGQTFTAPATIVITAAASDPDGTVTQVEFFEGANLLGTDTNGANGWGWQWTGVPVGSYTLTARATDDDLATTTSPPVNVEVQPPNTPPTVSIVTPAQGTIIARGSPLYVLASASDPDGSIERVEFWEMTYNWKISTDYSAPYEHNSTADSLGTFQLAARAYDNLGAMTESAWVTIHVRVPGDANGDTKVDATDVGIVRTNWHLTGATWTQGDFSGDGRVDSLDVAIIRANWDPVGE